MDCRKFLNTNLNHMVPAKDHIFSAAVETLQQLKTTFSPTEKLSVIQETIRNMTPFAQEQLGENYIWNMDDLFPAFLYVVVRARILQLGSELDFIENFMEPSLESGELGIIFTTLKVKMISTICLFNFYVALKYFTCFMENNCYC